MSMGVCFGEGPEVDPLALDPHPVLGTGLLRSVSYVHIISKIPGLYLALLPSPGTQKGHTTGMFIGEPSLSLFLCEMAMTTPSSSGFLNEG